MSLKFMAQLDVLLILPFVFGIIPLIFLHYSLVLNLIVPYCLSVKKMRVKKQNFLN